VVTRADIDTDDVTKVGLAAERVSTISKKLSDYDGFDTGAFLCAPDIMDTAAREAAAGHTGLSETMQALASAGKLSACRVDGHYWQDVDTPAMHRSAERGLLDWATSESNDGAVARWLNRPCSRRISKRLIETKITPNQISIVAFLLGLLAALILAQPYYWALLLGGILVQLASVVDGCDGEIARLRLTPSAYGGWLDALLDRYADAAVLGALTWHVMQTQQSTLWMWLGLAAITGSFVSSYSAHKADQLPSRLGWRIGRDTRSLTVMLGGIFGRPDVVLWLVAIAMNAVVFYRIFSLRRPSRKEAEVAGTLQS